MWHDSNSGGVFPTPAGQAPHPLPRSGSRFEADVASEAAYLAGEVTGAIVGQPLDGDRQAIDRAEAMLDGSEHQITNVFAADAARGGKETHGLAIT